MLRPAATAIALLLAAVHARAQAPAAPILTFPGDMALNVSITTNLKWKKAAGATLYHVQLDTGAAFALPLFEDSALADTAAKAPKLSDSTKYFWRVRAANASGFGAWSKLRSFTTTPPLVSGPGLVAPAFFEEGVPLPPTLKWNAYPEAKTYAVQISLASNFSPILFQDTSVADTLKKITGLEPGVTYYWHVRANILPVHTAWSKGAFTTFDPAAGLAVPGPTDRGLGARADAKALSRREYRLDGRWWPLR